MRLGVFGMALVLVGLWTPEGAAAELLSVAIIAEPDQEATINHLTEQLRALGFEVVQLAPQPLSTNDQVRLASQADSRVAVLRPRQRDGAIELYVVGERGVALSEVLVPTELAEDYRHTAAVRAVENLRATLVRLGVLPPSGKVRKAGPTREKPSPAPAAQPPPEDDDAELWLELGGAVLRSNGGVGSTGHGLIAAQWDFSPSIGVRGFGVVPIWNAEVSGPEGTSKVAPTLIGADLVLSRGAEVVTPEISVGIAAAMVDTDGDPVAGYAGQRDDTAAALPHAGVAVRLRFGEAWGARAGALVGTAMPRTDVMFGARQAASWGGLVMGGTLSVEARAY